MNAKKLWGGLAIAGTAGALYGLAGQGAGDDASFRFVEVERGAVEQVVTSTGTLQATQTVEVGTQVSGLLSEVYVDFNHQVKKGDLLAQIDPTILQQAVRSAEASLGRSTAELEQARRNLERATELFQAKVVAASDVETAQYQYDVVSASLEQARVGLEQARRNLEYAKIRAPIDGVVIERAVDAGQTVAASMSAPVLFLIAEDLSEMEILATVDEGDIGLIHQGQAVRFTVQAYPEGAFLGEVRQVRLQSSVVENVVTYGVVIGVDNGDGTLLPGMTATVEFIVARAEDVLKVSNSALRFQPTEAMRGEMASLREPGGGNPGSARGVGEPAAGRPTREAGQPAAERTPLYFLDEEGKLAVTLVEKGLTDRQSTVISGPGVVEGMRVIASVTTGVVVTASNPFQSQSGTRAPGGPPPM